MSIATMRKALTGVSGVPVTAYDGKGEVEPRITAKVYERSRQRAFTTSSLPAIPGNSML